MQFKLKKLTVMLAVLLVMIGMSGVTFAQDETENILEKKEYSEKYLEWISLPEEEREVYMQVVTEQMTKYQQVFLEHRIVKKDGSIITVFCYGISYYDSAIGDYRDKILAFNVDESNLIKNK